MKRFPWKSWWTTTAIFFACIMAGSLTIMAAMSTLVGFIVMGVIVVVVVLVWRNTLLRKDGMRWYHVLGGFVVARVAAGLAMYVLNFPLLPS